MLRRILLGICAAAALVMPASAETITYLLPAPLSLPAFGPFVVAKQRGYFKAEGLDVTFQVAKGGVDVAKQVGAGNAVIGGGIGDTPIIVRPNGVPVKAVAVLGGGALMQLVLDKDKGLKTVKDLKGKTITVLAYQDTTYFALLGMLASQGMTKDDVNAQAAGPVNVWKLFLAGQADAFASTPDWTALVMGAKKNIEVIPSDSLFKSMAQAIIASDETIKKHPELIQKIVRATLKGMKDIMADPVVAPRPTSSRRRPISPARRSSWRSPSSSTTSTSMAARRCWARWTRRGCRRCRTSTSSRAWCGPRRR